MRDEGWQEERDEDEEMQERRDHKPRWPALVPLRDPMEGTDRTTRESGGGQVGWLGHGKSWGKTALSDVGLMK